MLRGSEDDNNEDNTSSLFNKENALYLLKILRKTGFISAKRKRQIERGIRLSTGESITFTDFQILYEFIQDDYPELSKAISEGDVPGTFRAWWKEVTTGYHDVQAMRKAYAEEKRGIFQSNNPHYIPKRTRPPAGTSEDTEPATNLKKVKPNSSSVSNLPTTTDMVAVSSSNSNQQFINMVSAKSNPVPIESELVNSETPVDNIPLHLSKRTPFKKTEQAILGYQTYKAAQTLSATTAIANCYRLNSIYDCETITTHDDDPSTITADTADATVNTPMWRNYYMNYYRFWHVVGCKWKVLIEPTSDSRDANGQYTAYLYFHGLEHPPLQTVSGALIEHKYRKQHPGVMWKHFTCNEEFWTSGVVPNVKNRFVEFSGFWKPGMIKHEVAEDEMVETWHKATEPPPTPELMTIMVQPGPRNGAAATTLKYRVYIELEYYTQFKDLKTIYQWVMPDSDIPAITDYVAQAN